MPWGLKRFHQSRQLHFLTFSCYHRRPNFGSIESRRTFESALERVRTKYGLYVYGYVVMPEHVHLLVSEPERENPGPSPAVAEAGSRAQAGSARRGFLLAGPVLRLQRVERKEICEKLRYIHRNPVRRGLVARPEDRVWSSFRHYATGETCAVEILPCHPNTIVCTHIKVRGVQCGSPAVRGEQFCYFHQRMFRGVPTPPGSRLHPVALLESDEAIQASIMEVVNALARNTIDLRRADLILKALWIAVKNSRRSRFDIWANRMVTEIPNCPAPAPLVRRTEVEAPAPALEMETSPASEIDTTTSAAAASKKVRAARAGKG